MIDFFGDETDSAAPDVIATAPGRVNLLGEHTDYNNGYVLPAAIGQSTRVALRVNSRSVFRVHSVEFAQASEFTLDSGPREHFAQYVYGCMKELVDAGVGIPAMDVSIRSSIPMGAGLSSSAALEVATLRALRQLLRVTLSDLDIARMAHRAEVRYAGVNCGIMDQMAVSVGDPRHMLFIDTSTLAYELRALPADSEILVVNSGISRSLATSKYNERRAECERAAHLLGIRSLREVHDRGSLEQLPPPLAARARHVVDENARVLQALEAKTASDFGALMNASHRSLSADFEVSVPDLDTLADLLRADHDVFGAKLTGAGFGGACVALCRSHAGSAVGHRILPAYLRACGRGATAMTAGEMVTA